MEVKILNQQPGRNPVTNIHCAKKLVRKRRARWVTPKRSIELIRADEQGEPRPSHGFRPHVAAIHPMPEASHQQHPTYPLFPKDLGPMLRRGQVLGLDGAPA